MNKSRIKDWIKQQKQYFSNVSVLFIWNKDISFLIKPLNSRR